MANGKQPVTLLDQKKSKNS